MIQNYFGYLSHSAWTYILYKLSLPFIVFRFWRKNLLCWPCRWQCLCEQPVCSAFCWLILFDVVGCFYLTPIVGCFIWGQPRASSTSSPRARARSPCPPGRRGGTSRLWYKSCPATSGWWWGSLWWWCHLHVTGVWENSLAIGVSVPSLLVNLPHCQHCPNCEKIYNVKIDDQDGRDLMTEVIFEEMKVKVKLVLSNQSVLVNIVNILWSWWSRFCDEEVYDKNYYVLSFTFLSLTAQITSEIMFKAIAYCTHSLCVQLFFLSPNKERSFYF